MERFPAPPAPAVANAARRGLYAESEPTVSGWLAVGGGHEQVIPGSEGGIEEVHGFVPYHRI